MLDCIVHHELLHKALGVPHRGTRRAVHTPEFRRRVDLTVTEPNLIVTKEVCNETDYGIGPACTNFLPLVDDGDAFDTYVFRVTIENQAAADGHGSYRRT